MKVFWAWGLALSVVCYATGVGLAQQAAPPLAITTEVLPPPLLHQQYQAPLQATGGVPPLHWKVSRGNLPDGLNLDESSGVISGVPTKLGESEITVSVIDSVGNTVSRDFKLKVSAPLLIEWSKFPQVQGNQIVGSVKVANGTDDSFDLTAIILAVNEYGKAFALGYQHFDLKPQTADVEIPFGSETILPVGSYVVHADAVAEVPTKNAIYRARQQTPAALQVSAGP
ncbi:MAG TPA: Ig domain-containing protein [Terriglobales bacterium]